MPQERVKSTAVFPGSDDPIRPITEEKLIKEPEPDESEEDEEKPPEYRREDLGPRIGAANPEAAQAAAIAVAETKEQLDTEDVVPLIFSKPVSLQDKGIMHHWAPGVHLVPVQLAGRTPKEMHFWLKHNKVRRGGKVMANPNAPEPAKADA